MSLGTFDTYELIEAIEQRKGPQPFFMTRYFSDIMEFEKEEVHFDLVLGERRMAPFVSPVVEGKVMRTRGSTMKSFRPAYVKPKQVVRPTEVLKRRPGESLGGSLTPEQRLQLAISEALMEQDEMLDNRIEWMCFEIMKNGTLTVEGEDYPKAVVDYGRDANNSVTLLTTARWNDSAPAPLTDLEDLSTQMSTADYGAPAQDVYMGPNTWKYFRANADVKDLLNNDYRGSSTNINRDPMTFDPNDGPRMVGNVGEFNIWVDSRQYENDAGSIVPYFADGDVILASSAIMGVQGFGAILDKNVLRAMRAYPKTWEKEDPSVVMAMTQSAPLPIAKRINATGYIKAY